MSHHSSGDWSSERKSSVHFLGETVNMEASVDHHLHHLPLRLYVDSCVATLTADVNSYPRYPFIDHQGCVHSSNFLLNAEENIPSAVVMKCTQISDVINVEGRCYI